MLALDEEVDYLEYQQYLRSQSSTDLCDIVTHLDRSRCPRRAEAAIREFYRRTEISRAAYRESDNLWRKFLLVALAVVILTFFLGLIMPPDEALSPQPPPSLDLWSDGSSVQFLGNPLTGDNQMTVSILGVYAGQVFENFLRDFVQLFAQCGGYLLLMIVTACKLSMCLREKLSGDPLRLEVRRLLVIAFSGQLLMILSASWNNLPLLATGGHVPDGDFFARSASILIPWA